MPPVFRNSALNGTKPISAKVYISYINELLEKNPSMQKSIDEQLSGSSKKSNIIELQKNAENASKKVIELKEQLAKAEENAKQLSDKVSELAPSNNSAELPIQFIETFHYGSMRSINLLQVSPLFKEVVDNTFIINDIDNFDPNWINECEVYVSKLSLFNKITLLGYTHHGDEYINSYLRDSKIYFTDTKLHKTISDDLTYIFNKTAITNKGFPLYAQLFKKFKGINDINNYFYEEEDPYKPNRPIGHIKPEGVEKIIEILNRLGINKTTDISTSIKILEQYIIEFSKDLDNIIKNAPKLSKHMKVFRGIKNDYIRENTLIKGFTSTSISLDRAEKKFSNYSNNNTTNTRTLYEIILTSNTPCLFIPPRYTWPGKSGAAEYEVLIGSNVFANPSNIKIRCIFNPPLDKLLWSFINFRNWGETFKTRIITFTSNNSSSKTGGRRKTYKNKKSYKSKKYTKKHRY
jgi:hypothetical protein